MKFIYKSSTLLSPFRLPSPPLMGNPKVYPASETEADLARVELWGQKGKELRNSGPGRRDGWWLPQSFISSHSPPKLSKGSLSPPEPLRPTCPPAATNKRPPRASGHGLATPCGFRSLHTHQFPGDLTNFISRVENELAKDPDLIFSFQY